MIHRREFEDKLTKDCPLQFKNFNSLMNYLATSRHNYDWFTHNTGKAFTNLTYLFPVYP